MSETVSRKALVQIAHKLHKVGPPNQIVRCKAKEHCSNTCKHYFRLQLSYVHWAPSTSVSKLINTMSKFSTLAG